MGKALTFGWRRDLPDFRDYSTDHPKVQPILGRIGAVAPTASLPASVDLRSYCSPIKDQGDLGACTAHAGISMVEFFTKKYFKKYTPLSRLFVYKVTRKLMKEVGDTGAYLRTTMGALSQFGAPPEEFYPYTISKFDADPEAFLYAFGQQFQSLTYFRLDKASMSKAQILTNIKMYLSKGFSVMFGFTVYDSIYNAVNGHIPIPKATESVAGGHAVLAVGYNDSTKELIIQNSWGTGWGDSKHPGFGYLPYWYVENGVADDFWSLTSQEYVDINPFKE